MKKILFILFVYLSEYSHAFATIGGKEAEKAGNNTSFILNFFSTDMLLNVGFAVIVISLTIILSKIADSKITSYIERSGGGSNREELVGVLTRTSNISILTIGFSITLGILGVDMGIFMGGLGFGLGFTLKIFLSNFIAGVIMVTQGSYHNGDLIEIEEKTGVIKKINALFTEVEQFDGVIFFVPNVKFLENNVKNYYTNSKRRIEIKVGVDYDTDLIKAKKIILQVINNFSNILKAPYPEVIITNFENSSVNIEVRFWIDSKGEYFETKSNVTETINLAFKQAGITIPFPQITLSNRKDFNLKINN